MTDLKKCEHILSYFHSLKSEEFGGFLFVWVVGFILMNLSSAASFQAAAISNDVSLSQTANCCDMFIWNCLENNGDF